MAEQQENLSNQTGPLDHSLILVAVMPSPRDFHIARVLGWYRIPFKFAPKIVYVDYLAFYQPSAFGKGKEHRISFIAPVRGVELTTRQDLFRDEPSHPRATEEYYKIQIGTLIQLKNPILANKWKRITFLYTTGEYLRRAQDIKDLVIRDEERKMVWRTIRERQMKFETNNAESIKNDVDDELLMLLTGLHGFSEQSELFTDY